MAMKEKDTQKQARGQDAKIERKPGLALGKTGGRENPTTGGGITRATRGY